MPSEPKGGPDVLRDALEDLATVAEQANGAFREYNRGGYNWQAIDATFARLETQVKAAREALAASPPAEPPQQFGSA
jgi:hypothetical protein